MSRKALIITCVISLVVNLGFVGFLVGKILAPHFQTKHASTWTGAPIERILQPLGAKRLEELSAVTAEYRTQQHAEFRELRRVQRELYQIMTEDPFDADRLKAAQTRFNALFLASKESHDQMWLDIANELTLEERQLLMRTSMPRRYDDWNRNRRNDRPAPETPPEP